ncbi:MAG: DUF6754 domain-containing protein [Thermoanaerobaculia bacterium]|nr:DUF6754 domain-containing protein [Thermoanaerobaculia bacterium]
MTGPTPRRPRSLQALFLGAFLAAAAGGQDGAAELVVSTPPDDDGLTLVLTWTAAEDPAAWAILRADGSGAPWTVLTDSLTGGTRSHRDRVTTDPANEPPASSYSYRLVALAAAPEPPAAPAGDEAEAVAARVAAILAAGVATPAVEGRPDAAWIRTQPGSLVLLGLIVSMGALMFRFTLLARAGREVRIRRIPGIDAIEEGVGRATEMGRPVLYVPGIDELQDIQTIAAMLILGQVSRTVAEYQSDIVVSCCIPIVREVADEVVRAGYYQAGHPDAFRSSDIRFISSEQFAFCAGTSGIILREKPATNLYLGRFFAESLILAETGFMNGSIQIAGTAEPTQLPFFVAACDYTLIGEELFAVSAYLSRDPRLVSSLQASDWIKVVCVWALGLGTAAATCGFLLLKTLFTIAS